VRFDPINRDDAFGSKLPHRFVVRTARRAAHTAISYIVTAAHRVEKSATHISEMSAVQSLLTLFRNHRSRPGNSSGELEFLSPAAELTQSPPSPIRLILAQAICALFLVTLLVCWFGRIDVYAVALGRIQPAGRSKVIQPLGPGSIHAIDVQEGQTVSAGSALIELDSTEADADRMAASAHLSALNAEIARRRTALAAVSIKHLYPPPSIAFPPGTPEMYQSREAKVMGADMLKLSASVDYLQAKVRESEAQGLALHNTIESEQLVVQTLSKRVKIRSDLEQQGWESTANVLDAKETLDRENATITTDQGQLLQNAATVASLKQQIGETISEFYSDYTQGLEKAENDLDQAVQDLVKAGSKVRYTRLTSPIDGTVQQLSATTIGQVVAAGEQLMTIVPRKSTLEIEALVPNRDIGFVKIGQRAVIKVDAFPYTRYGTISGTVTHVSRDSLQNSQAQAQDDTQQKLLQAQQLAASPVPQTQELVFPVIVALDTHTIYADGQEVELSPGMSGTVEIKSGDRRVLEYLLSPFVETESEAAHER